MQVSANVAAKNATQATSSSKGAPSVKPNGSNDNEAMSFSEFEQRLDKSSEPKEEVTELDEASSAEPSQPISAEAQATTPESTAFNLTQQTSLASSSASSSAMTTMPLPDASQAGNLLPGQLAEALQAPLSGPMAGAVTGQITGQEAGQQANPILAQLTGQGAPKDPAKAELLEQMQQLVKQQKTTAGDALSLAKDAALPVDSSLMDKLAATALSSMNMHSNISSQINSHANMTMPSPSAATSASATQQLHAGVDITEPEWGRDLVDQLRSRLQLSKNDQIQHAHVRLDPPELGRLEVNLRLDGDKVSVHFTAAHPQLREALAANADRLRFDFDGSQMELADVSVSSGLYQQSHQQSGTEDEQDIMANQVMMQHEDASPTALPGLDGRYEAMV